MLSDVCDGSFEAAGTAGEPPAADAPWAAGVAGAAADSFDLARFTPPPGRRDEELHVLRFTQQRGASFCRIAIHRSVPAQAALAADFAQAWLRLVLGVTLDDLAPAVAPACRLLDAGAGWTLAAGAARIALSPAPAGVALLMTWGGHGRRLSVVAVYDDEQWRPAVDAFAAGIRLAVPPAAVQSLPGRAWTRAVHADAAHATWTYVFDRDGSYTLACTRRSAGACHEQIDEAGRWRLADAYLMLEPVQAQRAVYAADGTATGLTRLPLEPMAYLQRTQYVAGAGGWRLVLSPVGGRPTHRDGPFPALRDHPKSYVFARAPGVAAR
jgi:hypothetical protein